MRSGRPAPPPRRRASARIGLGSHRRRLRPAGSLGPGPSPGRRASRSPTPGPKAGGVAAIQSPSEAPASSAWAGGRPRRGGRAVRARGDGRGGAGSNSAPTTRPGGPAAAGSSFSQASFTFSRGPRAGPPAPGQQHLAHAGSTRHGGEPAADRGGAAPGAGERHRAPAGPDAEDAAIAGGDADRAAGIGAEREIHQAGGNRGRRAAGGAAGKAVGRRGLSGVPYQIFSPVMPKASSTVLVLPRRRRPPRGGRWHDRGGGGRHRVRAGPVGVAVGGGPAGDVVEVLDGEAEPPKGTAGAPAVWRCGPGMKAPTVSFSQSGMRPSVPWLGLQPRAGTWRLRPRPGQAVPDRGGPDATNGPMMVLRPAPAVCTADDTDARNASCGTPIEISATLGKPKILRRNPIPADTAAVGQFPVTTNAGVDAPWTHAAAAPEAVALSAAAQHLAGPWTPSPPARSRRSRPPSSARRSPGSTTGPIGLFSFRCTRDPTLPLRRRPVRDDRPDGRGQAAGAGLFGGQPALGRGARVPLDQGAERAADLAAAARQARRHGADRQEADRDAADREPAARARRSGCWRPAPASRPSCPSSASRMSTSASSMSWSPIPCAR